MQLPHPIKEQYHLSKAFERAVEDVSVSIRLNRNDHLLREGKICKYVYLVRRGLIRCYFTRNETEVTTWFRQEEEFVVLLESFLRQKESLFYLQAIEVTELYAIHYLDVQRLLQNFPETRFIGEYIKRSNARADLHKIRATSMLPTGKRYEYFLEHFPSLAGRLSLRYIASYLDLSRASLARARRRKK